MEDYAQTVFKGKRPKIKYFIKFEKTVTLNELNECYRFYYAMALNEWIKQPAYMQSFLIDLVKHDWLRFLNYLIHDTVIGQLRYTLSDVDLVIRLIRLSEMQYPDSEKASDMNFSFCFLIGFKFGKKVSIHALRKILYRIPKITDDMVEFIAYLIKAYMIEQEETKKKGANVKS